MNSAPVSLDGLSGALCAVLIETVSAVSKSPDEADERLEQIASRLMTLESGLLEGDAKRLLSAIIRDLVGTEAPTDPNS